MQVVCHIFEAGSAFESAIGVAISSKSVIAAGDIRVVIIVVVAFVGTIVAEGVSPDCMASARLTVS